MEIQSIYGGTKPTTAAAAASDEDKTGNASGFAALLSLVGTQFKSTLGLGMDPVVIKTDAAPEAVRAPEPREPRQRPERSDEPDTKAKPAEKDAEQAEGETEEAAAGDATKGETSDAAAQDQAAAQQQAAQVAAAAVVDAALIAQTVTAAPVQTEQAVVVAEVETVAVEAKTVVNDVMEIETGTKATATAIDPQAVAKTEVKAAASVAAPEAVVKDTARVQQAISAYAPAQQADDAGTVDVQAETVNAETKATAKESVARTDAVRSAAAQDQASNLARLLGTENRIQVQVNVTPAQTTKQTVADVSIYNIYAGYTAADAISLANGQFGRADESDVAKQIQPQASAPAPRAEPAMPAPLIAHAAAQASVIAHAASQAPALPGTSPNAQTIAPARTDAIAPSSVQPMNSSGAASNPNMGFSAFTQSGQSGAAQQAQQAAPPNPAERPAATAQHVIDQIKVNITKAAKAGLDRVTIQLKPLELGRIEIKLEMSEEHRVRVTVTADNKETLALLQTDSRTLERTLNDAGLRTDANNLHFNLRSDSDAAAAGGQRGNGGNKNGGDAAGDSADDGAEQTYDYGAAAYARGGVDTFA